MSEVLVFVGPSERHDTTTTRLGSAAPRASPTRSTLMVSRGSSTSTTSDNTALRSAPAG